MRKPASYQRKYGPDGAKLLRQLQREAAFASAAQRTKKKLEAAVALGSLGGKARAKKLSAEALRAIGRKGARARWAKTRRG
jgi:hypothetical protein